MTLERLGLQVILVHKVLQVLPVRLGLRALLEPLGLQVQAELLQQSDQMATGGLVLSILASKLKEQLGRPVRLELRALLDKAEPLQQSDQTVTGSSMVKILAFKPKEQPVQQGRQVILELLALLAQLGRLV